MAHFFRKILVAACAVGATLAIVQYANAQAGFGISSSGFFKRLSGALIPLVSTDTIGSSGNRIAGIYTSLLDATSLAIGGAVSGDLTVSGNATVYGSSGITAKSVTATSTADTAFYAQNGGITAVNGMFSGTVTSTALKASTLALTGALTGTSATLTGTINGLNATFSGNVTSTTAVVKGNVNSVFSVQKTDGTEIFRVRTGGANQTKLYLDENNILINQAGTGNGKLVMGTANGIAVLGSDAGGVLWLQVETYAQSSGDTPITVVRPTINQSGTAGYAVLDINPTVTTEGSGSKHLLRIRKGSGSNFLSLTSAGVLNVGESAGVSTLVLNGGRSMTKALSATSSLDFGNSATAGTQQLTVTVTGASTGNACQVAQSTLQARTDEMYNCYVSAADTVSVVRGCYAVAGCGDPAAATVTVYVNN